MATYTGNVALGDEYQDSIFLPTEEELVSNTHPASRAVSYGGILEQATCSGRGLGTCAPAVGCAWNGNECEDFENVNENTANIYWQDRKNFTIGFSTKRARTQTKKKKKKTTKKASKKKKTSTKKKEAKKKVSKKMTSVKKKNKKAKKSSTKTLRIYKS